MAAAPMTYEWTGSAMRPLGAFAEDADSQFKTGERYMLEVIHGRSMISHDHQFAWVADAWHSLPENLADEYPSPDHLRRRALIAAGFYHETVIDAGTAAAALRVRNHLRAKDTFAYVVIRGPLVVERVAESQSVRAMGGKRFQESKTAIMAVIANLIGVEPETLSRQSPSSTRAGEAAKNGSPELAV